MALLSSHDPKSSAQVGLQRLSLASKGLLHLVDVAGRRLLPTC